MLLNHTGQCGVTNFKYKQKFCQPEEKCKVMVLICEEAWSGW